MLSYLLPSELIAQHPCEPRDNARLLVLNRFSGEMTHGVFRDLLLYLRPGDCLVLNDTKVIPARFYGATADTGGKVELLFLKAEDNSICRCLGQPGKRLKIGSKLVFDHGTLRGEVVGADGAERLIRIEGGSVDQFLATIGQIPLPPYIRRLAGKQDTDWYQTVYARSPGAVAAPTAGLHFTKELLRQIQTSGVRIVFITLHVGWGTFKPVDEQELREGRLHSEWFSLPAEACDAIEATKKRGGRVIAVGTTVVRALETFASEKRFSGMTDLFIRTSFQFKMVDALITNFHLPGTSLLLLVSAFAGEEKMMVAYQEAIQRCYRFYSYGDAMLIF